MSIYLPVDYDISNRWTDMVLLYSNSFNISRKGFLPILDRYSHEITTPKEKTIDTQKYDCATLILYYVLGKVSFLKGYVQPLPP